MTENLKIGFIGQGFIGKNYADDFENRGYDIVRYSLDTYAENKDKIKDCDITLIAVPTPSTPEGFDYSIVEQVLPLIGKNKIAVIKSTIKVGTARKLQEKFPDIIVMHSPEFLTEKTAAYDAQNPDRNIVGITDPDNKELYQKAELVLSVLAPAPYNLITKVENAELIKYGGNCWFYVKVIFMNILYDLAQKYEIDYEAVKDGMMHDLRIGPTHLDVVHQGGRGAGGHCFIKDFETFIEMTKQAGIPEHLEILEKIRDLNLKYLRSSGKNLDLIKGVYGK
ncbi:UDP-glucose/GDP-mannose dehydrogenase family protein [Candidatus Parcubacteria bacterium]|nr:MAG: UDP-glucose/GDP-mannose dehydrogenase family protein [Candidatus Parcubacteria bacterium]